MSKNRDVGSAGPVVQKRDVFLVAGLIASWIAVVYFFVHTNKTEAEFIQPQRRRIHVDQSELMPALLQRVAPAPEEPDLPQGLVGTILESMKHFSNQKPDSFGLFVTAEPTPPVMANDTLLLEQDITRGEEQETVAPDEASGQEGELLESEPAEPAAPPSVEQQAPALEPIKS